MTIKPIETIYNGYRFRSRLEARWAVFFDTLNIEYRYEAEGFDLDGVRYLPDFFLPKQDRWIEVKPDIPTPGEREKAVRLCLASEKHVSILAGDVWSDVKSFNFGGIKDGTTREGLTKTYSQNRFKIRWITTTECFIWDENNQLFSGFDLKRQYAWGEAVWLECSGCGHIALYGMAYTPCRCERPGKVLAGSPRLTEAFSAARQARFEYEGRQK
jgi:hypothetical protein